MADYSESIQNLFGAAPQQANLDAVSSVEDDPEKAARAIRLGQDAGIAPSVVYGDIERFESNHKAQLTSQLLQSNPHLSDYIASHPMAAKVSNDDWANLDNVSQALDKHRTGLLSKVAEGFKEGVGVGGIGSWIKPEDVAKYPVGSIGWALIGAPIEVPMRLLSGVFKGAQVGAEELGQAAGMDRSSAKRLSRDLLGMAEYQLQQTPGKGTGVPKFGEAISQSIQAAKPWLYAGKEPPLGLDKQIDELKKQQSAEDLKSLDELTREAQSSATRERAPELFENFIALKNKGSIGISADAITELYGNKKPHPEDNLLGWVPDLEKQLWPALASGGDIEIPLATWLARVEPEVAKELHDHIRVRKGGITKAEGEVLSQSLMVEAYHGSPHEFDAFSMEKIGTGEGAQSYGHGLYFAENPEVAKSYAVGRQTGGTTKVNMPGNPFSGTEILDVKPPTNYRVRIHADKEQFLDWDKALSEQSEAKKIFEDQHKVHEMYHASLEPAEKGIDLDVATAYQRLSEKLGGPEAASKALREAGIPGIKYRDQGSRVQDTFGMDSLKGELKKAEAAGDIKEAEALREEIRQKEQPTYNFVIFDDSLIEITHKNDQAVQGVRKAAGLEPLFEEPIRQTAERKLREGEWIATGASVEGFVPKEFTKHEQALTKLVDDELQRLVPKGVETEVAVSLRRRDNKFSVGGAYTQFRSKLPVILFALKGDDAVGVARHEAIHHLRAYGFFNDAEWAMLEKAAKEEGWLDKPREGERSSVRNRYGYLDEEKQLEEAIADEFRYWNRNPDSPTIASKIFQKLREFLQRVKEKYEYYKTQNPEVKDIFAKIESGEIGQREPTGPKHPEAFKPEQYSEGKQGELDVTRQEDKKLFATIAGWMNKAQQEKYMSLIDKQRAEDAEFMLKKAERIERAKQTAEWKQAEGEIRGEVEADIGQRPDLGALEFFRTGKLYGEETGTRPRVDPMQLTEEQRKAFPEKYQRRDGMAPEDVAQLFGYTKFDDLAAKLQILDQEVGNKTTSAFMKSIVDAEVERRMVAKFGDLEENILREAQEHVISDTQMDLLHEEVVALGMKTGSEMTFTKADFRRWVEEKFKDVRASEVSLEGYLRDAGKAGRDVEAALLKDDPTLAFQQKQRQLLAMLLAEQAKKFEKERGQFERLAKRYSQRVVKGVDQGFADWIQKLLLDAGEAGRRSALELQEATQREGFSGLREFVDYHKADGWELAVDEGLQEGKVKSLDQMSVQEFRDYKESLDSLNHVGRKVNKIIIEGNAVDLAEFKKSIVDNIKQLPPRDKNSPDRWAFRFDSELTKMEEIFKDLDLRKELGPLFNAIVRPMADAKHTEFSMIEKLTTDLKEIKGDFGKRWQRSLKEDIPNDFLIDPHDKVPFDLSREHMINIMLNFGNRSNIEKFTKGYGGKDGAPALEQRLWQMFEQHATKEDWQYVEKIWGVWEQWRKEADNLYYDLAGVPPKWIEPVPINNRHGTFTGGYFPVIYDRFRSNLNVIEERQPTASSKGMFGNNYFRATPGNSYTKTRTGYIDAIQFMNPVDQVAARMQQTIHDISFRRAVMEAGKVLYDRDIRSAMRKHYGQEYEAQLDPWLKKVANQYSMEEANLEATNGWLRRARVALIVHALGFNLKVIFSPATGTTNFADLARYGLPFTEKRSINSQTILAKSKELEHTFRNIDRDYREQLDATIKGKAWDEWQTKAMQIGFWPTIKVDQYFRESTFFNEYNKALQRGVSDGEAIAIGDSAVRERHGSGAVTDLPAVMRSNEALKMATVFYGFFNTMYNWQRQIPGQLRRGEYAEAAKTGWGALVVPAIFGAVLFNERKENESVFSTWAKAIPLQLASTIPLARDVANQFIEGHGPRTPWTSVIEAFSSAYSDLRKKASGKKVDQPIKHAANVIGLGAGLPLGQIGRTAQFGTDVALNKPNKQPRNILEWIRGVIHGEARLKKERK